ncbi:MAG: hypothetical protein C5B55_00975 [Blastocatellia bacterium]|nr:MAG: hypothetical protein C5B55_00975 [Blastocatellia bacterium]
MLGAAKTKANREFRPNCFGISCALLLKNWETLRKEIREPGAVATCSYRLIGEERLSQSCVMPARRYRSGFPKAYHGTWCYNFFKTIDIEDPNMNDVGQTFLDQSRRYLSSDYLPKIERCLDELSDEEIWWRPNEASNSIGNLLLHLSGNVRQWIIGGVGGREFVRHRQQEFDERRQIAGNDLRAMIKSILAEADEVLSEVTTETLSDRKEIQGNDVTVMEAIYHVVEHFGMHTGQIIYLSKMKGGSELNLWRP